MSETSLPAAYTAKQWEQAAARTDFADLYCLYYILGTSTIRRASGTVCFINRKGEKAYRFVAWDVEGKCGKGPSRLPQYDLELRHD